MSYNIGDAVRRKASNRNNKAYGVGSDPFVVTGLEVEFGSTMVVDRYGARHDLYNLEPVAPTPPSEVKVGDKVMLFGSGWQGDIGYPNPGTIVTITQALSGNQSLMADGGAHTLTSGSDPYDSYSFVLVESAPEPEVDATGYPVGTPRADKDIPETSQVKGTYQETGEGEGDRAALLAEFNRWYERELEEARAEGYKDGYARGFDARGILEAADLAPWERELVGLAPEAPGYSRGFEAGANAAAQKLVDNLLHGLEIPE